MSKAIANIFERSQASVFREVKWIEIRSVLGYAFDILQIK